MKYITNYCRIKKNTSNLDGVVTSFNLEVNPLTVMYKKMELNYPKFYKMDTLAKAAFLGSELIKTVNLSLRDVGDDEVALVFSNSESSVDSDKKFYNSYHVESNPSPSQFVYTLPNILTGEIAIRNKWFGENMFFISPSFDSDEFCDQIDIMFSKGTKVCLCGWINVSDEEYDVFLFTIENTGAKTGVYNSNNLLNLYNQSNGEDVRRA